MKKICFAFVVFILSLVTLYDYFITESMNFISLGNVMYQQEDTISNIDEEVANLSFPADSVFQKAIINKDGNYVIVTKKNETTKTSFYLQEYNQEFSLINSTRLDITKISNKIYPEEENNLLIFEELEYPNNVYAIMTNRNMGVLAFDQTVITMSEMSMYILQAYFDKNMSNTKILYNIIDNSGINEKIVTTFNNNLISVTLPVQGHYYINADDSILHIDDGLLKQYSKTGEVVWEKLYKKIENNVRFNQILPTSDGNLVLVGSYFAKESVKKYQLFYNSDNINSIRDGVILKIDVSNGEIIWERVIKGYNNDKIDMLSIIEDNEGNFHTVGYYDIKTPTIFFNIDLDKDGNITGDKIFQFIQPAQIKKEESLDIYKSNLYYSSFALLYRNDTTAYNKDSIMFFSTRNETSPFIIHYTPIDTSDKINYLTTNTLMFHNYLIIVDTAVVGLFVVYLVYEIIHKFDRRNKKKARTTK